jgi:hypothetical protein
MCSGLCSRTSAVMPPSGVTAPAARESTPHAVQLRGNIQRRAAGRTGNLVDQPSSVNHCGEFVFLRLGPGLPASGVHGQIQKGLLVLGNAALAAMFRLLSPTRAAASATGMALASAST